MKKREAKKPTEGHTGPIHSAAMESQLLDKLVALRAHCCVNRYDDGEPRRTGWVTIKTLGTSWVITLKEPDTALSLSVTGATLDDALVAADVLLQSTDAPWEPDVFLKSTQGSSRKRA